MGCLLGCRPRPLRHPLNGQPHADSLTDATGGQGFADPALCGGAGGLLSAVNHAVSNIFTTRFLP